MKRLRWSWYLQSLLVLALVAVGSLPGIAATSTQGIPPLPKELQAPCKLVLVEFFASWCSTCRWVAPYVANIEKEAGPALQLIHIEVDKPINAEYVQRYRVSGTPTFILFSPEGKPIYAMDRYIAPNELRSNVLKRVTQLKRSPNGLACAVKK
jgi:thioredoxin 1